MVEKVSETAAADGKPKKTLDPKHKASKTSLKIVVIINDLYVQLFLFLL